MLYNDKGRFSRHLVPFHLEFPYVLPVETSQFHILCFSDFEFRAVLVTSIFTSYVCYRLRLTSYSRVRFFYSKSYFLIDKETELRLPTDAHFSASLSLYSLLCITECFCFLPNTQWFMKTEGKYLKYSCHLYPVVMMLVIVGHIYISSGMSVCIHDNKDGRYGKQEMTR